MYHAKAALHLLKQELALGEPSAFDSSGPPVPPSAERLAVLAIAYHNLGVQQENLELPEEALQSFAHAVAIAQNHIGPDHPITGTLRAAYEAANLQISLDSGGAQSGRRGTMSARARMGPSTPRPNLSGSTPQARTVESIQKYVAKISRVRDASYERPRAVPHVPRDPDAKRCAQWLRK